MKVDFGKYEGDLWTRVPSSYLLWLKNNHNHADIAEAELKRRGTVFPTLDLSGHAINRASTKFLDKWKSTRRKDEGLYTWLLRMAVAAIKSDHENKSVPIVFKGIQFVFQWETEWPVLMSVAVPRDEQHKRTSNKKRRGEEF